MNTQIFPAKSIGVKVPGPELGTGLREKVAIFGETHEGVSNR